jgi:hypothetical protein
MNQLGEYEIDGLRYEQDQDGHEYYELQNSPAVDRERLDDATDVDEPVPIEFLISGHRLGTKRLQSKSYLGTAQRLTR